MVVVMDLRSAGVVMAEIEAQLPTMELDMGGGLNMSVDRFMDMGVNLIKLLEFYQKNKIKYAITVNGDCMSPILKNGDVVRICFCEQYQVGDIVVCVDIKGVRYIHRIFEIVDGKYITKADNNLCIDVAPITYDKIFGKVVM